MLGSQRAARYMKDHGGGSIINNVLDRRHQRRARADHLPASKAAVIAHASNASRSTSRSTASGSTASRRHISTPAMTTYDMAPVLQVPQPLAAPRPSRRTSPNAVVFLASDRAAQITGIVLPDRRRHHGRARRPRLTRLIMSAKD